MLINLQIIMKNMTEHETNAATSTSSKANLIDKSTKNTEHSSKNESFLSESLLYIRGNFESVKFNTLIDLGILTLCAILFYANEYLITPFISYSASGTIWYYLITSHANDFLGGVAFMTYTNLLLSLVRPELRFKKLASIAVYIFFCGLFWEYIAPLFVANSISDPLDILAYLIGATLYWAILLVTKSKHKEEK